MRKSKNHFLPICFGIVLFLCFAVTYGGAYRVYFVGESLTMSPSLAKDGLRVTFTFNVKNDGPEITKVQIRVVQPADTKGKGRVLRDLTGQVIKPGMNTYRVTGTFKNPASSAEQGVVISLLDRRTSKLPAPVITHSGWRKLELVPYYKLEKYVPLI